MDASSEAAEQIVRMTLEGTEVALRITGAGAKNAQRENQGQGAAFGDAQIGP